ncbi:uncharacterized protein [Labrus bergylta]|uniref:uncharacterized protein isoform X2 n=1 Tax=Labrus bergylta TaxID=56723 RepID=UPI003313CD15
MHLKQTGYCVGFFLVYTFITMISLTGGRCAAHFSQPPSHLAFHDDESNDLTTRGLRKLQSFNSRQKEQKNRNVTETESSRRRRTFKPIMTNKRSRKRDTVQQTEGRWRFSLSEPPQEGCSEGNIQTTTRGKFTITGQLEANSPNTGYQSDSAVSVQSQVVQQRVKDHQVSWLSLQPEVECGEKVMTLTVRRRRAAQLLLDRDNESPVPLTQLPPQCGYSVQASWKDLRLMAEYDACHVIQEDDHFVLPLLWRGTPVRMSCPSPQMEPEATAPSSLCCSPYSLTVKLQGVTDTWELRVDVRGEWTPLVTLVEQCGYTVAGHDAEVIITAPYVTCGITVKDGKHTISLQIRGKTFTLACPVSPSLTLQQAKPWAPPFYLAPPFYPHPRYHYTYPPHGARNPPTPEPTLSPQAPPPNDHQALYSDTPPLRDYYNRFGVHVSPPAADREEDSDKEHPDLQQEQEKQPEMHPAARSASSETPQAEAPPMQQHAFSQYYHYYNHPKIPLTGQPEVPDPGPEVPKQPSDHNLSPSVEPSEAPSSPSPPPGSPEFTHKTPEHETAHPPLPPPPYPDHYFYYFPQTDRGEAEKSSLLNPKIDDQNSESGIFPADNLKEDDLDPWIIDLDPRTIDLALQTDDLDPQTIDLDPRTINLDPRTDDLDPQTIDLDPQTDDLDPQTTDLDPQTTDLDPQTDDLDPQTDDLAPQTTDLDPQTDDLDPQTIDLHLQTDDLDPQTTDLDTQTDDLDPQTTDLDPQTTDLDTQTDDLDPQTTDLDTQTDDLDPQTIDLHLQTDDLDPQTTDLDPQTDDLDPQTTDLDPQTTDLDTQTDDLDPQTTDLDTQTDDLDTQTDDLDTQTTDLDTQTDDLDPQTTDLDPQTDDLDPQTDDLDTQTDDLDTQTDDLDPQTTDLDTQTTDLDTQTDDLDPQTDDLDTQTDDLDTQTTDLDTQTTDLDTQTDDLDPQTDNLDTQTDNLDPQTDNLDTQTDNLDPQTIDLDTQTDNLDTQTDNLDTQTDNLDPQTDDLDPQTDDLDPQTDDLDPQTDDLDTQTDDLDTQTDESHSDEIINFGNKRAERSKTPVLPAEEYDVKEVEVAPDPHSYPATSSSSSHHPPFYPFYLHSDYFNHSYSVAESSLSDHDRESAASSEQDLAPLLQATSSPPHHLPYQTPPSPTEPTHDVQKVHPHPYYSNHHLYDQPGVSADDQEHHPAGSLPPSHSDYSGMDRLFPRAQAGSPSMHQQLRTLYSHYINQQHPDEDEGQDGENKDPLKVDSYAPSTSPCGHMSYIDCLYSKLLKTYCSWRPHVIFMVPDFAMEHTAVSPGDPSEVVDQTGEHLFEAHDA